MTKRERTRLLVLIAVLAALVLMLVLTIRNQHPATESAIVKQRILHLQKSGDQ